MSAGLVNARDFSFASRPLPVPGDLRINWRIALVLLMLNESRARRASLAKLHVLNYAVRSERARLHLARIMDGSAPTLSWQMPIEPAFGRAIDFMIGEEFARWTRVSSRAGLELSPAGVAASNAINQRDNLLNEEKAFLTDGAKRVTESFVSQLLSVARNA